jgi:hypothetical protein
MISGTVEHEATLNSSQTIVTDNIQNYVLVGEAKFAAKLLD